MKELEQYYQTILLQNNTIIIHEKEIEKLKSEISNLQKQFKVYNRIKNSKIRLGLFKMIELYSSKIRLEVLKQEFRFSQIKKSQ